MSCSQQDARWNACVHGPPSFPLSHELEHLHVAHVRLPLIANPLQHQALLTSMVQPQREAIDANICKPQRNACCLLDLVNERLCRKRRLRILPEKSCLDCSSLTKAISNMSNISSTIFTKLLPLGCLGHLVARVALPSLPLLAGQVMICLLSCQIVRCQATWHTSPCWCARQISLPESKHRMNAKQQKTLTAAHGASFRRSEIADLPRDRQSGEPQRSQKELRNCQPIKALQSHLAWAVVQPTKRNAFKHLRLWTLIITG